MELELLSGAGAKASLAAVPSAVKAALTRKYNQSHAAFKKGLSSGPALAERYTEDAEDDGQEEEELDMDAEARLVKKLAAGAGKKAKAGGGASGKAAGKARAKK